MTTYLFEFMLQFLLAEFVFAKGMPRRKHFVQRIIGFGISLAGIMYGLTWLQLVFPFQQYYLHFLFLMLPLAFAYAWLCFDVRLFSALYIFSGGYCIQHISSNLYTLSSYFIINGLQGHLSGGYRMRQLPTSLYYVLNYIYQHFLSTRAFYYFLQYTIYLIVLLVIYRLFVKNRQAVIIRTKDKRALITALVVLLVNLVISEACNRAGSNEPYLTSFICKLYAIICCLLVLMLESSYFRENRLEYGNRVIAFLMKEKASQYEITKENIEHIQIRIHDMKHQLSALMKDDVDPALRSRYLKEWDTAIERSISTVDTGNHDLDIILTEKKFYCAQENIHFNYVIEQPHVLAFMDSLDVYALFSNALDNAIQSIKHIEEPTNRFIDLKISSKMGVISISVRNYCEKAPNFKNGLPVTQQDPNVHGFGMLSMRAVVRKYGGEMRVKYENHIFDLGLLFYPAEESAKDRASC